MSPGLPIPDAPIACQGHARSLALDQTGKKVDLVLVHVRSVLTLCPIYVLLVALYPRFRISITVLRRLFRTVMVINRLRRIQEGVSGVDHAPRWMYRKSQLT